MKRRSRGRIRVRRATLRDLDALVEQRRRMWEDIRSYPAEHLDAADREYRRWARRRMRSGRFVAWIAETAGGEAVAGGAVWLQDQQPRPAVARGPLPYLLSMYTKPEWRGRGLASRIVKEAMRWARSRGYPRMTLHGAAMGRGMYKKLGWARTWEMRVEL